MKKVDQNELSNRYEKITNRYDEVQKSLQPPTNLFNDIDDMLCNLYVGR